MLLHAQDGRPRPNPIASFVLRSVNHPDRKVQGRFKRRASARSSLRDGPVVCMQFNNSMHGMPNSRTCNTKKLPLQRARIGDHQHKVRMILMVRIEHGLFRYFAVFDWACRLYKPGSPSTSNALRHEMRTTQRSPTWSHRQVPHRH